jgi:hypothetical protein
MANTYLQRTVGTPTNAQKYTYSFWIKRCKLSGGTTELFLLDGYADSSNRAKIAFNSNEVFEIWNSNAGSFTFQLSPPRKFRDTNAWYHIILSVDTTQSTASDRVKLYVNGVQETSLGSTTYPSLNDANNTINESGTTFSIMAYGGNASSNDFRLSSIMSHIHFTDGYAYDASTFGETDATTGIWKPITEPSVTYGNNGFFLKFENSGSMGLDSSGNANNFTVNGTLTQTVDTPSNVFTTWNPLENYYQSATLSNGNTTIQTGSSQYSPSSSTLGVSSGKWYWEVEYDALSGGSDVAYVGVLSQFATNSTTSLGTNANDYGYYVNGNYYNNNTGTAYGTTYTTGDIIGVALDLDNNKLYFSKNGTWQNSGDPESGATGTGAISITNPTSTTNGAYFPSICDGSSSANATFKTNFGNGYFGTTAVSSATSDESGLGIFEYTVPSGYYALCTKNINTQG